MRVSKNCPGEAGKGSNQCEYQKMVESDCVPGKGRISATIGNLIRRVPEKGPISVSTKKLYNSSEYREKVESVRVSENILGEYRKRVQSV